MKLHLFLFSLILNISLQAQSPYQALNEFLNSPFLIEFEEMKERAEISVSDFKIIAQQYPEEEVLLIKDSYNASADYFNRVLENIKQDMLNRKKRKYMFDFPKSYTKQIEADLYRAKEYYANTYQKEVINLTSGKIEASGMVAMLPDLLKYAKIAVELIKRLKDEIRKFNESMLDQYLIEAYRFQYWDEIK